MSRFPTRLDHQKLLPDFSDRQRLLADLYGDEPNVVRIVGLSQPVIATPIPAILAHSRERDRARESTPKKPNPRRDAQKAQRAARKRQRGQG